MGLRMLRLAPDMWEDLVVGTAKVPADSWQSSGRGMVASLIPAYQRLQHNSHSGEILFGRPDAFRHALVSRNGELARYRFVG